MKWRAPSTRPETAPARFMAKVSPEPNSGCWLWDGGVSQNGYGNFHDGYRMGGAHKYSFRLHCGEVPKGMYVCHRCDVPICVNPEHLFLGTPSQNQRDMAAKDRAIRDFDWSLPQDLKDRVRDDPRPYRVLAEVYGLSFVTVKYIKSGRRRRSSRSLRLTVERMVADLERLQASGETLVEVSSQLGQLREALESDRTTSPSGWPGAS